MSWYVHTADEGFIRHKSQVINAKYLSTSLSLFDIRAHLVISFNCGEDGHWKGECPQPPVVRNCYKCGEPGHFARECPESFHGGGGENGGYGQDGGYGSKTRQWGAPRNHNEGGYDQGDSDRYGNDGPQGGGGGGGGRACFRCGDPGHFIADCSQPAPARFGLSAAGDHGYMSFNGSEDVNGFATKTQDSGYGNRRNRPPRIVADDDVPYGGTEKWNTPQEKAEQPNVEEGADQGDHADDGWGEEANDQENGESGHQSPDNSNDVDSNVKEVVDLLTPLTIDRKPHAQHVDDEEEYADADDGEASAEGVLSGADDGLSGWE